MATVPVHLATIADLTNLTTYVFASRSPTANCLQLVAVKKRATTLRSVVAITGCGLTWAKIADVTYNTLATPLDRLELWYALGASPTPGTLTVQWSGAVSQCMSTHIEIPDVPTTNGGLDAWLASNVKVVNGNTVTTLIPTADALADAANILVGFFAFSDRTQAINPETDWDELGEAQGSGTAADSGAINSQWRGAGDLTCQASWALGADSGAILVEIVSQPAGGSPQSGTGVVSTSAWVTLAGLAILGGVSATPLPATSQWVTPAPTAVASVTAVPVPAVSTWTTPAPSATSSGAAIPAPAISTWVTPAPVALSGAVTGLPSVAVSQWQSLAPTASVGAVTGIPAPSVSSWVAPVPTGSAGVVNQTGIPTPAVSTWATPQPTALSPITVSAPASSSTWVTPNPNAIAGATTGTAAPSVSSWVSPVPTALNPGLHVDLVVYGSDASAPKLTGLGVFSQTTGGLNGIHAKYAGSDRSRSKYRGTR